jgi:hypothetical protein
MAEYVLTSPLQAFVGPDMEIEGLITEETVTGSEALAVAPHAFVPTTDTVFDPELFHLTER